MSGKPGAVVIGRNEGERLARCLASLAGRVEPLVYVDSGSQDDSVVIARAAGAEGVDLDPATPFTAALARNAGMARLLELRPGVELVQFVDGDCEVQPGWIEAARAYLDTHPQVAVACGRRRERAPGASRYNRLADLEWDTPVGEADACGGDAMFRVAPFRAVGGYDGGMIAGEEPELCYRLRRAGHQVARLDHEMTLHDADLTRFAQWWRRNTRAGHAFAECAWRHGWGPERFQVRELLSILAWAGALPLAALAAAPPTHGWSLLALGAGYAWLGARIHAHQRRRGAAREHARLYAAACVIGKFPQLQGAVRFFWNRFARSRRTPLIEYKGAAAAPPRRP